MLNSIFSVSMSRRVRKVEKELAKASLDERKAVKHFMEETDPETISTAIQIVLNNGHPKEIMRIKEIQEKYNSGTDLEFVDITDLDNLYRSNINFENNKGDIDE